MNEFLSAELKAARSRVGPMARRQRRLAYWMMLPTICAVLLIILVPLLANFWISVKPVGLADLRPAKPLLRERVRGELPKQRGDTLKIEYRLRSSSPKHAVYGVILRDTLPIGLQAHSLDDRCSLRTVADENTKANEIVCQIGDLEPRKQQRVKLTLVAGTGFVAGSGVSPADTKPLVSGHAKNQLLSTEFTFENFRKVFDASEFWEVLWVSIVYTVAGTLGALVLGLFAAQLMHQAFPGRGLFRGLLLFPYVSPVIAVAFTWVFLLDPFSGTVNALLQSTGASSEAINFLGTRGLALWTVITFEAWRYFPLAFLFILARMQSLSADLDEAAEMDGATPFQKFRYIALPQLIGILSTLFLLRFIWTFNKFDDIFLLTGGASGTRTLTVNVYEQAFALSNLGAGAAVAVVIFFVLAIFITLYFRFLPKEEGM